MSDWSVGHYETTAAQLAPAARVVVDAAAVQPGERAVDLGCGTGNAALLLAEAGAQVTGVDPASRLLDVARRRADEAHLSIAFSTGDASAIPIDTGTVDVIVSVFAVIFAPDPVAAAAEMARVAAPASRIVLSAWMPEGGIFRSTSLAGDAVRQALGAPAVAGFPWHEPDALAALFEAHGFRVTTDEKTLAFTAPSLDEYMATEARDHPMAVAGMAVLETFGQAEAVRQRMRAVLAEANEDPAAFQVTSRYIVATLRRSA